MLSEQDQLRLKYAAGDRVGFEYRGQTIQGALVRLNPKRAVVQEEDGGAEFRVPYSVLRLIEKKETTRGEAELQAIAQHAQTALLDHGLTDWTFAFDHGTRRAGCCNYSTKTISISFEYARNAAEADLTDTLLHEIAHALVGRKHNHDAVWKAKAKEIGSSGDRCHSLRFSPPRWIVSCENSCWTATAERRNARLVCKRCHGKLRYAPYTEAVWKQTNP